jgi:hypothetical protein
VENRSYEGSASRRKTEKIARGCIFFGGKTTILDPRIGRPRRKI